MCDVMDKLSKQEFTNVMKKWLFGFLQKKHGKEYSIEVFEPDRVLSKLTRRDLKESVLNLHFFDFRPDILGIMKNKSNGTIELVFLNRETKAFGLREIGEMQCYCRLTNPMYAFLASTQGLASQIDNLINHFKRHEIIIYPKNTIKIFRWDQSKKCIDHLSVTPLEDRDFFL